METTKVMLGGRVREIDVIHHAEWYQLFIELMDVEGMNMSEVHDAYGRYLDSIEDQGV